MRDPHHALAPDPHRARLSIAPPTRSSSTGRRTAGGTPAINPVYRPDERPSTDHLSNLVMVTAKVQVLSENHCVSPSTPESASRSRPSPRIWHAARCSPGAAGRCRQSSRCAHPTGSSVACPSRMAALLEAVASNALKRRSPVAASCLSRPARLEGLDVLGLVVVDVEAQDIAILDRVGDGVGVKLFLKGDPWWSGGNRRLPRFACPRRSECL